jgi:L-asparagine transporter-like permease
MGLKQNGARFRSAKTPKTKTTRRSLGTIGLTGLGIGGIIGAGFFLGSGIVIRQVGPAVVVTYLLAGIILAQVMGAITSMAINVPVRSSYQEYIQHYLGQFFAYFLGWAVYISGILSVGSEAVAMAVYSRTWDPHIALGIYALVYVLIIIGLNLFGVANLGKTEAAMSVVKTAVLVGFMVVAAWIVTHIGGGTSLSGWPLIHTHGGVLPHGVPALFKGMLIVIYSYAGVTTVAMATSRTKRPQHTIPKAAMATTLGVVGLYALSVGGLMLLVPYTRMSPHQSPFVTALGMYHLVWFSWVFNAVILVASFSVMAGTFYATEWMLISMALEKGAPSLYRHAGGGRPYASLMTTALLVIATLVLAFMLPQTVYTDLTAASSYFSFVNWLLILLAFAAWFRRVRKPEQTISRLALGAPYVTWVMAAAIVALGIYSATVPSFRLAFYVFAGLSGLLVAIWFLGARRHVEQRA